ncbi:MAG: LPS export ABC transporter periplasmic protein LptC [Deltaproteobacteria bacterium]|jgi:LPS export ABC transporter protein LptC|nr:LPS export ABC transporter periplasmic protein LptC [Deltaproteobacteria bacterium]NOQ86834.1 LPS export ABC transporter periplasmic protein LptC [Deltaproteobacteria bacterium]
MKKVKFVLIAIASLTLILVMVALVRNSLVSHDSIRLDSLPPKGVDMQIGDIHYEQTDKNASKEWELNAKSAQYFKGENKIVLQSIELTFFSGEGKVYKLTADEGELYTDSKDVKVSGNVIVLTEEGYHVQADSFKYNAEERKIFTNDRVHLSGKELVMTGKGMVVDLETEKLYILEGVKALEKK